MSSNLTQPTKCLVVDKRKNHLLTDTRGELSVRVDVDKWALNSCLTCHFGGFVSANLARSTTVFNC